MSFSCVGSSFDFQFETFRFARFEFIIQDSAQKERENILAKVEYFPIAKKLATKPFYQPPALINGCCFPVDFPYPRQIADNFPVLYRTGWRGGSSPPPTL
ncbi:MAG TPA: hypothetical protein P5559_06595 [Candidatus Limiplasma sp.]|nr:hypothetical protein [Candidatus Limiplasma sp.]